MEKRLQEAESGRQAANSERVVVSDLQSQIVSVKTEHEQSKQALIKCEQDKLRLEADMKDCHTELRNMERDLEQARK